MFCPLSRLSGSGEELMCRYFFMVRSGQFSVLSIMLIREKNESQHALCSRSDDNQNLFGRGTNISIFSSPRSVNSILFDSLHCIRAKLHKYASLACKFGYFFGALRFRIHKQKSHLAVAFHKISSYTFCRGYLGRLILGAIIVRKMTFAIALIVLAWSRDAKLWIVH